MLLANQVPTLFLCMLFGANQSVQTHCVTEGLCAFCGEQPHPLMIMCSLMCVGVGVGIGVTKCVGVGMGVTKCVGVWM